MSTRKTWLLIAVILLAGLFTRGLRQWSATTPNQASRTLNIGDMEVRPFHVDSEKTTILNKFKSHRGGLKLAGVKEAIQSHDFGETHRFAQKAKVKTEDKKKKKKKKKKARGKKDKKKMIADLDTRPYYREEAKTGVNDNSDSYTTVAGVTPVAPQEKAKELPVTYEDWAKLVLGRPNKDEVLRMIDFYRSNLITAEVFYGILSAMLEENETQQLLAVEAAGGVPGPMSYIFLLETLKNFPNGSKVNTAANLSLTGYQALGNVGHLRPIVESHLSDTGIMAFTARLIDQSTELNVARVNNPGTNEPSTGNPNQGDGTNADGNTSNGSNINRRLSQVYLPFEPVLERAVQVYPANTEIGQIISRSLERIRTLKSVVLADLNQ